MSAIGFIGTGHIAAPMVRHLAANGHEIVVTERNAEVSAALAAELGVGVSDAQDVIDRSEIVFLCLRPHVAEDVLSELTFRAGQKIVSVMAGIGVERLRTICAPAGAVVQTVPLGFVEKGGCPLAALGDTDLLTALFEPENPVVPVADEAALDAHFAICAMVPGLLDLMATASGWLAARTGDADAAEFYTTQMMTGFLAAMDKGRAGRLAEERDALATEATLSLQMVRGLSNGGAHAALAETLQAIRNRLSGD